MSDAQYLPISAATFKDVTFPDKWKSSSPQQLNESGVFDFEDVSRGRSSTVSTPVDLKSPPTRAEENPPLLSQMSIFSMFSKIGTNTGSKSGNSFENEREKESHGKSSITSSLRRTIFNRVSSSTLKVQGRDSADLLTGVEMQSKRRTRDELRHLWKTAIKQQILLIQMEKENKRLRGRSPKISSKCIKVSNRSLSGVLIEGKARREKERTGEKANDQTREKSDESKRENERAKERK